MYYALSFKQKNPSTREDIDGFDIKSVRIFTTSWQKRQELIQIYKDRGFSCVRADKEESELPNGYEGKVVVDDYWFPNLEEYRKKFSAIPDVSQELLSESYVAEEDPMVVIPASATTLKSIQSSTSLKKCYHKFNCEAHRDICVKIHGLPPITTKAQI